jgi:hypothetical protein
MAKKSSRQPLSFEHLERLDRPTRERIYQRIQAEEALERAQELEARGWQVWYPTVFGEDFYSNLATHHKELLEWHWWTVIQLRAGLPRVDPDTYPAIWSRGHRKSNIARRIVVADACLLTPGYCLYTSSTKEKVRGHAVSIEGLLHEPGVREYYPLVGQVKRSKETNASRGWTADFLNSEANYIFHFIGIKQGVAGANVDDVRPSLIVLDDVDDREDSVVESENRLHVITRSVLPTKQLNTRFIIAQNYISRHGAVYRIHSGKEILLTKRVNTKPIPACHNLVTEVATRPNGVVGHNVVSCEPTWPFFDRDAIQNDIDTYGLPSFMAECMHDVEGDKSGQVLPTYDADTHLVDWEEFNAYYRLPAGNRTCPRHWQRYVLHDWGASEGHAAVVLVLAVAAQNSSLAGTVFLERCLSFPASTLAGTVARAVLEWVLQDSQNDPSSYIELALLDRATGDPGDALAVATRTKVVDALSRLDQYVMWHMGHDHKAVRDIYRIVYGLPFQPCNPGRDGGVPQINHYLRPDYNTPHPFRPDTPGHCRFYLLAEGWTAGGQRHWANGDAGLQIVREQIPEWRWRPPQITASGMLDERPLKLYDDVGNALMMGFKHFSMRATPLTQAEETVARIPEPLRYESLLANSPFERGLTAEQELAHLFALKRARTQATQDIERFNEFGERLAG